MDEEYDALLNILVIGEQSSGKTCLMLRFAECAFTENQRMTAGCDISRKVIRLNGSRIKLNVVDTMGQERFHSITAMFYRGADGIIVTYDVTNQNSFNNLDYWLEQVNLHAREDVCKLLVGCKSDLTAKRAVECNTALAFANQRGLQLIETSAKEGTNVELAFELIAEDIMQRSPPSVTETGPRNDVVILHRTPPANDRGGFNRCWLSFKGLFTRR
ncbi:ras-related protein ORAB-1-like isoform X6 [Dermacentor albipictus]|uniref:ras-related protein ORAB-1-like isoform X6 n=1 Tax=Dermacentor albipictus TaxID=60249 RepID=UPI0031FE1D5E